MTEPTTEAGRAKLRRAWFEAHPNRPIPEARAEVDAMFEAIEAEARQQERDAIRSEMRGMAWHSNVDHATLVAVLDARDREANHG